ncbi:MAG: anthranilate synthase component I family protein [Acetobacter indonesiensis]|nr:anthranilate synthase component I family protein [Acetobacter indonesiensis]MCI1546013.1 anthranilate synthase component I family protein [Acetobacter indonesiensis]MCI1765459.1 anthranilate synthase component I family protein [Acetobacter indonesiensis]
MGTVCIWAHELPWRDPAAVFAAWADTEWCAFLDSSGPIEGRSRWQIFCRAPDRVVRVQNGCLVCDDAPPVPFHPEILFASLKMQMPHGRLGGDETLAELPFFGGWVGFVGYGLGVSLEQIVTRQPVTDEPDFAAAFYDHAIVWDRVEKRAFLTGFSSTEDVGQTLFLRLLPEWEALPHSPPMIPDVPRLRFEADQPQQSYCAAVAKARDYIAAGDIFQVNITGRYKANFPENYSDISLYLALREHAPAPFGAYLACGPEYVLHSTSPERFLQVDRNGAIRSRPIKGTAPRGATAACDEAFAQRLANDEKERAENLMIVDLMRHDIGRVARLGSMSVPEFLKVERFAHVHHLVSEVQGDLATGRDVFDLLQATLPPGSVTGAPKHRALEIIDELEASPRGAYCGSVFSIGIDGRMESSVIIRSAIHAGEHLKIAAGGGITILSDPEKEYEEMRLKLAPFFSLFGDGA